MLEIQEQVAPQHDQTPFVCDRAPVLCQLLFPASTICHCLLSSQPHFQLFLQRVVYAMGLFALCVFIGLTQLPVCGPGGKSKLLLPNLELPGAAVA